MGVVIVLGCHSVRHLARIAPVRDTTQLIQPITPNTADFSSNETVVKQGSVFSLDVPYNTIGNVSLYHFINDWIGTPYKMGGNSKKGIDCSGFSGKLYADVYHIVLPRTAREQALRIKKSKPSTLKEGDLVFFGKHHVKHVGVYLTGGKFVHASTNHGVVVSALDQFWYRKNFLKGGTPVR